MYQCLLTIVLLGVPAAARHATGAATKPATPAPATYRVVQQKLGPVYARTLEGVSEDRLHWAYVAKKHRLHVAFDEKEGRLPRPRIARKEYKQFVVVDAKPHAAHKKITQLQFAPKSQRVLYVAHDEAARVVFDGKKGPAFNAIFGLVCSRDGKHFGYVGIDRKAVLVVDNKIVGVRYDEIGTDRVQSPWFSESLDALPPLVWSSDAARVAYVARRGKKWHVVVGGKESGPYDWADDPKFSPDGKRFAYAAEQDGKQFVVVDGKAQAKYDRLARTAISLRQAPSRPWSFILFSADSEHLGYSAFEAGKQFVVVDGKPGNTYDKIAPRSFQFSPNGKRWAYAAVRGKEAILVVSGKETATGYDADQGMAVRFSSDGRHVIARMPKNRQQCVLLDGKAGPVFDRVKSLRFSTDSKHWAYAARKGEASFVVVDGEARRQFQGIDGLQMVFSPNGKRLAYAAFTGGKRHMVVNASVGAPYDSVYGPCWSPDGKHLAYRARAGTKWFVVLDDKRGPAFDEEFPCRGVAFRKDGSLEYLAIKDKTLYRVRHVPATK